MRAFLSALRAGRGGTSRDTQSWPDAARRLPLSPSHPSSLRTCWAVCHFLDLGLQKDTGINPEANELPAPSRRGQETRDPERKEPPERTRSAPVTQAPPVGLPGQSRAAVSPCAMRMINGVAESAAALGHVTERGAAPCCVCPV